MVIDLTQDSDSEDQAQPPTLQSALQLPLRSPISFNVSTSLKRKSDRGTSEESLDAPPKRFIPNFGQSVKTNGATPDFTAVRTPSLGGSSNSDQNSVSVVIPSPSINLKKELERAAWIKDEPLGVSQNYFPTDAYEKRAVKGAYPVAKRVNRGNAFLSLNSSNPVKFLKTLDSAVSVQASINAQLIETLRAKLQLIKGPRVTVMPRDELALAVAVENFQFVNSYQLRQGVKRVDESFNAGCTCGSVCDPARCTCLEQRVDSDEKLIPYMRCRDDRTGRSFVLSPEFLSMKSKIYECNSRCSCEGKCWNTMVQNGRTVRLEIFHTGNRGFGLRSLDTIRAGQFIDRYLGEIITSAAASKREELALSEGGHSYLFVLDWVIEDTEDSDDSDPGLAPYVVDGQKYGSPTRFMNHSCNPNCKIVPASRNHGDDRIYDLAFFAVRDIPALTELTFDYNPGWEGSPTKIIDPDALPCLCGEPNCRNQLWPNTRKGTK